MTTYLQGLVAATHTPFLKDGTVNLAAVEKQAPHLIDNGIQAAFVCGTTGESHSLTLEERLSLVKRWSEVVQGTKLTLIVHVGSNCLPDACTLARHAQEMGSHAISALAPSYFKPKSLDVLVAWCSEIARAAPDLPFYFYDIPALTGVSFSMPDFLETACSRIPNLRGIKFTNPDLMSYQRCLHAQDGRFDVPWGVDEYLLAALACGAVGAVGSSYNFAAPVYHRMMAAYSRGDMETARAEQFRSVRLIEALAGFGYMAAAKAVMSFLGVDVGGPRLPHASLTVEDRQKLRSRLEHLGFFDWIRP